MDACSVILLAKAAVLETLTEAHIVTLTKEVYEEVMAGKPKMFPDALLVERLTRLQKIKLVSVESKLTKKLEHDFNMGSGEASIIAGGIRTSHQIIATDNKQGRTAAKINNLKVVGSIELIVALYKSQKISQEKAVAALNTLQKEGWFEPLLIEIAKEDLK